MLFMLFIIRDNSPMNNEMCLMNNEMCLMNNEMCLMNNEMGPIDIFVEIMDTRVHVKDKTTLFC